MTTPAAPSPISMNDVRNETGDTGAISFSDWFVRQVSKSPTGPVALSGMRDKTCHPGNSVQFGINYVNTEIFMYHADQPAVNSAYWMEFVGHGTAQVRHYGDWSNGFAQPYTDQGGFAFVDVTYNGRPVRAYRGAYKYDDPANPSVKLYAIRWVQG